MLNAIGFPPGIVGLGTFEGRQMSAGRDTESRSRGWKCASCVIAIGHQACPCHPGHLVGTMVRREFPAGMQAGVSPVPQPLPHVTQRGASPQRTTGGGRAVGPFGCETSLHPHLRDFLSPECAHSSDSQTGLPSAGSQGLRSRLRATWRSRQSQPKCEESN